MGSPFPLHLRPQALTPTADRGDFPCHTCGPPVATATTHVTPAGLSVAVATCLLPGASAPRALTGPPQADGRMGRPEESLVIGVCRPLPPSLPPVGPLSGHRQLAPMGARQRVSPAQGRLAGLSTWLRHPAHHALSCVGTACACVCVCTCVWRRHHVYRGHVTPAHWVNAHLSWEQRGPAPGSRGTRQGGDCLAAWPESWDGSGGV